MDHSTHTLLKLTREQHQLSLADVCFHTRIPVAILAQLEAGNYAAVGNMAYARSFLKNYGEYLGVDVSSAVNALPKPILGGATDYKHLTRSLGTWVKAGKRTHTFTSKPLPEAPTNKSIALKAAVLVGLISAGAVGWAIYLGKTESAQNARQQQQDAREAAAASAALLRGNPAKEVEDVAAAVPVEQVRPALIAQ